MDFVACTACRRHVRAHEARCPFCLAMVTSIPRAPRALVGRITRAAIFYGASLSACASEPSTSAIAPPDYGVPMQPVESLDPVAQVQEAAPVEVIVAMQTPELHEDAARERRHAEGLKHPRPVPMPRVGIMNPYGAPAFDFVV